MDVIHPRCAGLDISKKDAKVCVRIADKGRQKAIETVTTWSSMTNQILALREHLVQQQVTCVVMEATGNYWKPFYYLLEDLDGVQVMLVNARDARKPTGPQDRRLRRHLARTTGRARAVAGLARATRSDSGATRPDPDPDRDHPRTVPRGATLGEAARGAGIKLSVVATDIMGVSGRAMPQEHGQGPRRSGR